MFNSKRIEYLEECNKALSKRLYELCDEVAKLKAACTMRVGEDVYQGVYVWGIHLPETRPVATAIELINQMLERQKLTVEAVPAESAKFTLTKN